MINFAIREYLLNRDKYLNYLNEESMKKKKYVKPMLELIDIRLNDLCAASTCVNSTTDTELFKVKGLKEQSKKYTISNGDSKDMWDSSF